MERTLNLKEMNLLAKGEVLPTPAVEDENIVILKDMLAKAASAPKPAPVKDTSNQQFGTRASNRERSGTRDMTVSANARPIGTGPKSLDTIRHFDGDLMQVCSRCARTYIFIEDSADAKKASTYTRALAEDVGHTAWAMLIIHHPNDVDGLKPIKRIKVWANGKQLIRDVKGASWTEWREFMEYVATKHNTSCKPRKRFE